MGTGHTLVSLLDGEKRVVGSRTRPQVPSVATSQYSSPYSSLGLVDPPPAPLLQSLIPSRSFRGETEGAQRGPCSTQGAE